MADKVHHYIVTWRVENFCFCDREKTCALKSSSFPVQGSQITWHLSMRPNYNGNCRVGLIRENWNVGLQGPMFKYTCSNSNGDVWYQHRQRILFKSKTDGIFIVNNSDALFLNFQANLTSWNSQIFVCEMICRENETNSGEKRLLQSPDIRELSDGMKNIFQSQTLADVTLHVNGGTVKVHKAILWARSSVFARMFEQDPHKNNIEIPHIELDVMDTMISFLYSGNFEDLFMDGLPPIGLYECAKEFAITELKGFLYPQEIHTCTKIKTTEGKYTWRIEHFCSLTQKSGEFIESEVFKLTSSDISLNLRLYPNGDIYSEGYIGIFVLNNTENENRPLQLLMRVSLIDESGEFCHTKQCLRSLQQNDICGFDSFICRASLLSNASTLIQRGILTVHCHLTLSFGEYESEIHSVSESSSIEIDSLGLLSDDLKRLYFDKAFSDATLIAEDSKFPVHRCVLSARSPVFARMFEHEMKEKETGEVIISDIKPGVLDLLLQCIYCGKVNEIASETALELYYAAEKYTVSQLGKVCSKFLESNLEIDNSCDILFAAHLHSDVGLKEAVLHFICCNIDQIIVSNGWKVLCKNLELTVEIGKRLAESYRNSSK